MGEMGERRRRRKAIGRKGVWGPPKSAPTLFRTVPVACLPPTGVPLRSPPLPGSAALSGVKSAHTSATVPPRHR